MKGVKFGDYHSYTDLDLILTSKTIGDAATKKESVSVPGSDGELDLTEYFGEPRFNNRELSFRFSSIKSRGNQPAQYSAIENRLNGRKVKIVLDADPDYYYIGRLAVGNWTNEKCIGKVEIKADCEPWKYRNDETVIEKTVASGGTVTVALTNERKTITPKITTTGNVTVAWEGKSVSLSAGADQIIPDLQLKSGTTSLTLTGAAVVTFKYRKASL